MVKKLVILLVLLAVVFSAIPVSAAECPVIYKSTITVTKEGGVFQVGFVSVEFKKDFLDRSRLPVTIQMEVSAAKGVAGIDLNPGMGDFNKPVYIRVNSYKGLLYDKVTGRNIRVDVKRQQLLVKHFSRHAFS